MSKYADLALIRANALGDIATMLDFDLTAEQMREEIKRVLGVADAAIKEKQAAALAAATA